jgi:hypothetical protein
VGGRDALLVQGDRDLLHPNPGGGHVEDPAHDDRFVLVN